MLRIKLVRSTVGHTARRRRTVAALGLRKLRQVVELPDNPAVRGMIHHVHDMVSVEVCEGEPGKSKRVVKAKTQSAAPKTAKAAAPKDEVKPQAAPTGEAVKKPAAKKTAPTEKKATAAAKKPAVKKSKE